MTKTRSTVSTALAATLAALSLAGCGGEEAPVAGQATDSETAANEAVTDSSSNSSEETPRKASAEELAARRGDSPGKPVAPIDIDYEVLGEPRPGEPVEIELKLRSSLEGPATLQLQPRDGLQMGASQASEIRRETIGRLAEPAAEPAAERVVVIPPAEGRFYLSVLVSVATAEGEQIRAVSIPVQVGDQPPAMQQNGELTTTDGETVRSLPAKETDGD